MSCTNGFATELPAVDGIRPKHAALRDARGVAISPVDPATLELYETALVQLQSYVGDPVATIEEALKQEPDFILGHAFRATVLATFSERRFIEKARVNVASAEALLSRANARERGLVSAARALVDGDWDRACRDFDRVLVDHPRDAFAIQSAHLMDFFRGDARNLRDRITRVLPHWSPNVPGYSYILGMHAFGLEECNQYAQAEQVGRRALSLEPKDAWAVHAVAHVMEMEGRIDEGLAWLSSREEDWAPDNGFAFHNYWHLALFYLDGQRYAEALAVYDRRVHPAPPDSVLALVDATALLWRLHLGGAEVRSRAEVLASNWAARLDVERGFYVFNDVHAMMAFAMAGREVEADRLLSDVEWTAENGSGTNLAMTREVGLPICRAIRAFGRQHYGESIDDLLPVRDTSSRMGGSHAQRDVLSLTLIEAAIRSGRGALAAHYIAERTVQKPGSALGWRLHERATAAAAPASIALRRVELAGGPCLEYAERGSGPAIVFLHGYTDSWRSFEETLNQLPLDVRALALTQRGHGDSDRTEAGYRIADFGADVIAFLDALGLEKVTLVGHSMGSLVAQHVASAHPDRISRLVLVGSATAMDSAAVQELASAVRTFGDAVPREFAFEFQSSSVHRPVPPAFLDGIVDESMKVPARVWRATLEGFLDHVAGDRLKAITAPTLVIWGDHDLVCPRDDQDEFQSLIPRCSLRIYEGTGHTPHWEETQRFVSDLMSFVRPQTEPPTSHRAPRARTASSRFA